MGTHYGAVEHMLPVISQSQVYQGLQQGIPDTLFSPTPEPNIDRVPLAVAFMHVPLGTACAQNMQYAIEKQAVVSGWSSPTSARRRQKWTNHRPFMIPSARLVPCLFSLLLIPQAAGESDLRLIV